jgi:hypothetical protein
MSRQRKSLEHEGGVEEEGVISLRRDRRRKRIDEDLWESRSGPEGPIELSSAAYAPTLHEDMEGVIDILSDDDDVEFVHESPGVEEEDVVFVSESIESLEDRLSLSTAFISPRHRSPAHNVPFSYFPLRLEGSENMTGWGEDQHPSSLHETWMQSMPFQHLGQVSGGPFFESLSHDLRASFTRFRRGGESVPPKTSWKDIKRPRRVREVPFSQYKSTKGLVASRRTRSKKNEEIDDADLPSTCPCCLEEFEDKDQVWVLPCNRKHVFHPKCIKQWLVQGRHTCPTCRGRIW